MYTIFLRKVNIHYFLSRCNKFVFKERLISKIQFFLRQFNSITIFSPSIILYTSPSPISSIHQILQLYTNWIFTDLRERTKRRFSYRSIAAIGGLTKLDRKKERPRYWKYPVCWSPEVGVIAAFGTSENYVMDQSVFDAPVTSIEPRRSLDRH